MSKVKDPVATNIHDNDLLMERFIESLTECEITATVHEEKVFTLNLESKVVGEYGGASFTRDQDEYGLYHFNIDLKPANAKRLVQFLLELPPEPNADE